MISLDALADQRGTFTHSLTVRPAAGLDPTLESLDVNDLGESGPMDVTLKGLTLINDIEVNLTGGTGHAVPIKDVTVTQNNHVIAAIYLNLTAPSAVTIKVGGCLKFFP